MPLPVSEYLYKTIRYIYQDPRRLIKSDSIGYYQYSIFTGVTQSSRYSKNDLKPDNTITVYTQRNIYEIKIFITTFYPKHCSIIRLLNNVLQYPRFYGYPQTGHHGTPC